MISYAGFEPPLTKCLHGTLVEQRVSRSLNDFGTMDRTVGSDE